MTKEPFFVHEDTRFVVVQKPACMHSTGDGGSVEQWLRSQDCELVLLQRLDFETSGLMVAARGEEMLETFSKLQKEGGIEKQYLAVTEPVSWHNAGGRVCVSSRYRHSQKVTLSESRTLPRGRFSETYFHNESVNESSTASYSLIRATLHRGLRHQVRAHLAHLGAPLVGDALYGSPVVLPAQWNAPPFILHACTITITFDRRQAHVQKFDATLPGYLKDFL